MFRNARNSENGEKSPEGWRYPEKHTMVNLAKNRQRASENLNEVTRGASYKAEKLTKMANLAKIRQGFGKY